MDYCVHRLRFSDWQPAPIKTLAADPFSCKIAIGREDGDIEICDASHKWYNQARIPGQTEFNLQCLVWAAEKSEAGRLFGISLRGFIFEVDLSSLVIKNIRDSYGGAVWCLASCPRHAYLAVGCEDGGARLFNYDGGVLEYHKSLPTTGSRILCVSFHPSMPRLFMGCDDGTIRCLDETTGRALFRMTGDVLRGVSTYIWSILVLSDSTVVSGDSRGHVQLWDGETGVLMITLHQHTAEVLALAVSPDETQIFASGVDCRVTCVRKVPIAAYKNDLNDPMPSDSNWVYSTSHRPHSHDVFTLAVCNSSVPSSSGGSGAILISGGMDTKLCSYSIEEFARTRPAWILPVSPSGLVQSSADYSAVAVKHRNRIDIWSVQPSPVKVTAAVVVDVAGGARKRKSAPEEVKDIVTDIESSEEGVDDDSRCNLSLRLETKGPEHIHCFAMSGWGSIVACSTTTETRIWSLKPSPTGVTVQKLKLPNAAIGFCQALAFSDDGGRLAAYTSKGSLLLLSLAEGAVKPVSDEEGKDDDEEENSEDEEESDDDEPKKKNTKKNSKKPTKSSKKTEIATGAQGEKGAKGEKVETELQVKLWHSFDHSTLVSEMQRSRQSNGALGLTGLSRVVTKIVFSADGMYLAVADAEHAVYVYDIDRLRLHWRLPLLVSPVTSLAFHPKSTASLVVTQANNSFLVYEADEMSLSEWSKSHSADRIKSTLKSVMGPISGITFDPSTDSAMLLYGQQCIVYVDLTQSIPKLPKIVASLIGGALNSVGGNNNNSNNNNNNNKAGGRGNNHQDNNGGRNNGGQSSSNKRWGRKGEKESDESNFAIIQRYRSLVHVGCVSGSQLVVVENPWVNILGQLPDTLVRKRYGT